MGLLVPRSIMQQQSRLSKARACHTSKDMPRGCLLLEVSYGKQSSAEQTPEPISWVSIWYSRGDALRPYIAKNMLLHDCVL